MTGNAIVQLTPNLDAPITRDTLTQDEYEGFRDALPNWRDRLIAMVLRNTGLRVNEVLNAEVRQFVLIGPDSILYVQRSKKRQDAPYEPLYLKPELGVHLRDCIKGQQMAETDRIFGNSAPRTAARSHSPGFLVAAW